MSNIRFHPWLGESPRLIRAKEKRRYADANPNALTGPEDDGTSFRVGENVVFMIAAFEAMKLVCPVAVAVRRRPPVGVQIPTTRTPEGGWRTP